MNDTAKQLVLSDNAYKNNIDDTDYASPITIDTIFNLQKLTSKENFLDWFNWISFTINSFKEGFDFKRNSIKWLFDDSQCLSYSMEMLIKFLILKSVDNSLLTDIYGHHIAIIMSNLANHYGIITTKSELELLNRKFTIDYSISCEEKIKEWELLQFMNDLNSYPQGTYIIIDNICVFAAKNSITCLDFGTIDYTIKSLYKYNEKINQEKNLTENTNTINNIPR